MISIFSIKFLLVILNLIPLASYWVLFNYFTRFPFSLIKQADFIVLFFGASYIFIFKYILFENISVWSDIFPYFLILLIVAKFIFLRKIIKLPILALSLIVSAVYPIAYFSNAIDMAYHPYIIFVYHSFWVVIFINCAKKIKESNNNLSKP